MHTDTCVDNNEHINTISYSLLPFMCNYFQGHYSKSSTELSHQSNNTYRYWPNASDYVTYSIVLPEKFYSKKYVKRLKIAVGRLHILCKTMFIYYPKYAIT